MANNNVNTVKILMKSFYISWYKWIPRCQIYWKWYYNCTFRSISKFKFKKFLWGMWCNFITGRNSPARPHFGLPKGYWFFFPKLFPFGTNLSNEFGLITKCCLISFLYQIRKFRILAENLPNYETAEFSLFRPVQRTFWKMNSLTLKKNCTIKSLANQLALIIAIHSKEEVIKKRLPIY